MLSESNIASRPVIRLAISPQKDQDLGSFQHVLRDIAQADPTLKIKSDTSDGPTVISGISELHLATICSQISHGLKIPIDLGQLEVIYVETIRAHAEAEGRYIRQTGGSSNYGHCKIRISPNESDKGYEFTNETKFEILPMEYIKPIDQGIQDTMQRGILSGYEMVDIKVSLLGGSCHDFDSNEMAFKIAASMAFKEAARKAKPILLEPIMTVEVTVTEDHIGTIVGDLNSRRGRIESIESYEKSQTVTASVPLSEMLGYATYLNESTRETGTLSIRFARYEASPPRDQWGGDEPGITANRPNRPSGSIGSAANQQPMEHQ